MIEPVITFNIQFTLEYHARAAAVQWPLTIVSDQINRFVNRGVDLAFRNAFDPLSHFCRPPKHLAVGLVERFPSETGFQAAALRRRDEKQFILVQTPPNKTSAACRSSGERSQA